MTPAIIIIFTGIATVFILLSAIGMLRMPDFYLRLSVTVKATTLGIGLVLLAAAIFFGEIATTSKVLSIIFFLILTAPVAAQMIGRAAYFIGVPLWKNTVLDELKDKYDPRTGELSSGLEERSDDNEQSVSPDRGNR